MGPHVQKNDDDDRNSGDQIRDGSSVTSLVGRDGGLADARDRVAALETSLATQTRAHVDVIHLLSHELRTPITVISGFSRLLLDPAHGPISERQRGFINECLRACGRLDVLVGDLLEASSESGSVLDIEIKKSDLGATIRSTLEALSPLLMERGMQVEADLDMEHCEFEFDAGRIEQVVTNLLTNAIRYGQQGGLIRVGSQRIECAMDSGTPGTTTEAFVQVHVEDDGPGIPVVDRSRVFEPYVRGEGHFVCAGMGIGLAICRRIVASHGGSIRVEEGSLGGARFVFTLPLAPNAPQEK